MGAIAWLRMADQAPEPGVPVLFYDAVWDRVNVGDVRGEGDGAAFWPAGGGVRWHPEPEGNPGSLVRGYGGPADGRIVSVADVSHWAPIDVPALTDSERAVYEARREQGGQARREQDDHARSSGLAREGSDAPTD